MLSDRTSLISAILRDLNLSKKQNLTCQININNNKIKNPAAFMDVKNDSALCFRIVKIITSCILESLFKSCKPMFDYVSYIHVSYTK